MVSPESELNYGFIAVARIRLKGAVRPLEVAGQLASRLGW
jgi:hypothetical protein